MPENLIHFLVEVSIWAIPIVLAFTVHEVMHGFVARHYGDNTAERMGRLTLNPLKHIDPIGTVAIPSLALLLNIPVIGWARPVPINPQNLRHPRTDMAKVAAAGPASNLVQALIWALLLAGLQRLRGVVGEPQWLLTMCSAGILVNVLFAVLNMLPIPPLDGSRVLRSFVSPGFARVLDRLDPFGFFILFALLYAGVLNALMAPLLTAVQRMIAALSGIETG
ncbi:MAG TPA: site-2 protease family protein [Steroidobacteraceae bacterium]|nr:site-2 protease family protein [Steroidobacteraceae bacterium]